MCMRAIELPTAPYGVCIDTEAQWRIWAWILHASPPLHGFLGFKRKPCLHDQVSHLQIYARLQIRVFSWLYCLHIVCLYCITGIWRQRCLVPKNIVKTGCVYISDHLNLRKIVLIRTTMLLYDMTLYFSV